jgi:hypothetical protein
MDTDTEAETIADELLTQVDPSVLHKLLALLERGLRRITIQRILEEKDQ